MQSGKHCTSPTLGGPSFLGRIRRGQPVCALGKSTESIRALHLISRPTSEMVRPDQALALERQGSPGHRAALL